MRLSSILLATCLPWFTLAPNDARADAGGADQALCHVATAAAEHATGVPDQLLTAISRVESGRTDPNTGRAEAWPWTINVEGAGHLYPSKQAAIAAVTSFEAQGARSIDVGCMQINLLQHPEAFTSLEQAFDPTANAMFAAHFLTALFQQTGSWPHAAAAYHSQTPQLGHDYQNQVLAMWAQGDGPVTRTASRPRPDPGNAGSVAEAAPSDASSGSPFGSVQAAPIASRYGPRPTILAAGVGRSLAEYRSRPIALASRVLPQRF